MSYPETIHGIECVGKTDKMIRDEYLYLLVCPYCSKIFEGTHTQVKPKTGRKLGKNHCGCQTKLRRQTRLGIPPANKLDDRTRTLNQAIGSYKAGANNRGLEYNLTDEQVERLIFSNCYFCGIGPSKICTLGQGAWTRESVPINGIDRIDSGKGYTTDNVLPCCTDCNYLKVDRKQDEFLAKIKRIYENLELNKDQT